MRSFRPRPVPTVAVLVFVVVTVNLGRWQLRRDVERNALRERMLDQVDKSAINEEDLAAPVEDLWGRKVGLDGAFEGPALLEEGRPGPSGPEYGVVQAFRSGSALILVDRGSIADPAVLPAPVPRVDGVLVPLSAGTHGGARGRFPPGSGQAMRAATPGALDALIVTGNAATLPEPDYTSLSYAVQWFLIASAAIGAWLWASWGREATRGGPRRRVRA